MPTRWNVAENRVLRRISFLKREGIAEWWRGLHNENLHNSRSFLKYH
jgi:hypothetical protein